MHFLAAGVLKLKMLLPGHVPKFVPQTNRKLVLGCSGGFSTVESIMHC